MMRPLKELLYCYTAYSRTRLLQKEPDYIRNLLRL